jgi:hypothetical protein
MSGRPVTAHPGEPPAHPLRPRDDDDPPPPLREQLPLPRRSQQGHLEPQLRVPGGSGEGTPFTAFGPAGAEAAPGRSTPGDRAAAFHDGTARGRVRGAKRGTPATRGPDRPHGDRDPAR